MSHAVFISKMKRDNTQGPATEDEGNPVPRRLFHNVFNSTEKSIV